jgi:DNA-binding transcriptional LysR family regulator
MPAKRFRMADTDPSWELYRSFLAVFREGSLSGAARAIDLTQPTIGRHVEVLETALGISLFTRSQRGLVPTAVASALVPHVEAMASAAGALRRTASGEALEERGVVRVTASEMVGVEVLPPALASFREAHSRIDVELVLSNRTADLLRREADIAVRNVKPTQTMLVTRKLGAMRIGLYAHPRYLQAHGTPRSVDALGAHAFIGFDSAASVRTLPDLPFALSRNLFAFRCDSDLGQYAAVKAAFGVGFCQAGLAKRDGLIPVLRDAVGFDLGVWLVMHKDAKVSRRVRLLFEHLGAHLKDYLLGQAA